MYVMNYSFMVFVESLLNANCYLNMVQITLNTHFQNNQPQNFKDLVNNSWNVTCSSLFLEDFDYNSKIHESEGKVFLNSRERNKDLVY